MTGEVQEVRGPSPSTIPRKAPWVRKARAAVAAYADCTESQMMAIFGWTDPKMPAHYIAQANQAQYDLAVAMRDVGRLVDARSRQPRNRAARQFRSRLLVHPLGRPEIGRPASIEA